MKHAIRRILLVLTLLSFSGCTSNTTYPGYRDLKAEVIEASEEKNNGVPIGCLVRARARGGMEFTAFAEIEPFDESRHGKIRLDGSVPRTALKSFRVTMNGTNVTPPESEYSGFGSPSACCRLEQDQEGLVYVYLRGGDGAGFHERRFVYSKSKGWLRTEYYLYPEGNYYTKNRLSEAWEAYQARLESGNY